MSYALQLTDNAKATIKAQELWYEEDESRGGAALADRWFNLLEAAIEKLLLSPHRSSLAPENGEWLEHLVIRQVLFRPWKSGVGWRILFSLDEEQQIVTVHQVRHERRRLLSEPETEV